MAKQLTIELEDARQMCARLYGTHDEAVAAGERLRSAGYRVNRYVGERVREDGAVGLAAVLRPNVGAEPDAVGEIVYLPPPQQIPQQRRRADPGE